MYMRCPRCTGLIKDANIRQISLVAEKLRHNPETHYRKSDLKIKPIKDNIYEDAYKIAEKALKLLQRDDVDSVMKMIRQNHDLDLSVTWNYLIRHKLDNRRLNAAFTDFQNVSSPQGIGSAVLIR